mmetsp:Transcript_29096/g.86950  ORF Transcript_29096/g.86950 Transcript_29096/m.86950 type:complete len:224 (-) Transcript_29096:382-1053(-)
METPAKSPWDRAYVYTGATASACMEAAASRLAPMGPATAPTWPPRLNAPPPLKQRSASSSFKTMRKSATCAPIWKPKDAPMVPMAEGADHESASRATTQPVPKRADTAKPALVTLRNARPLARRSTCRGGPDAGDASILARIFSALAHSSSRRKFTRPGPSEARRRSIVISRGRPWCARMASTTARYLGVGTPPTATTRSPTRAPALRASPPSASADTAPSPP